MSIQVDNPSDEWWESRCMAFIDIHGGLCCLEENNHKNLKHKSRFHVDNPESVRTGKSKRSEVTIEWVEL